MERNQKNKQKGNGEGTLYKSNKTGLYIGQYVVDGKRKSVYQKKNETSKDFKARFTQILNSINTGTYIDKSKETVITLSTEYIESKYTNGSTSERSYSRDLETIKQIEKTCKNFCNKPIQKVTIKDIEEAKKEIKKYSNSVIKKIWGLLNKSFSLASSPSRRILVYNIMADENLKKPLSEKPTKKVLPLTDKEHEKLINILDNEERNHPYRNIIKMQDISGMRIGEVLARSLTDYNIKNNTFHVHNTLTQDINYKVILGKYTKTYNKKTMIDEGQRYLPLDNKLFKELIEIIEEQKSKKITNMQKLLFWDYEKNFFITPNEINSWLTRINKKYNICKGSLSTHRLRHGTLTNWRNIGIPLSVIQYLAGHVEGSTITSSTYIDTSLNFVENELKKII